MLSNESDHSSDLRGAATGRELASDPATRRGTSARSPRWESVVLLILGFALSAGVILQQDGRVPQFPMDQHFVQTADLRVFQQGGVWQFHYPILQHSGGITASLTIGVYKLLVPTTAETLNHHAKLLGMVMLFGAGFLVAAQVLETRVGLACAVLLMFTSGVQFVEPSSEAFAGAFLLLFLYGYARRWHFLALSLLLACFGLCKVELVFVAVAICLYWMWRASPRQRLAIAAGVVAWSLVFLLPSLILFGSESIGGERALNAFWTHYPHLFAERVGDLEPGGDWRAAMDATLPGVSSFRDLVTKYPKEYFSFVALAALLGSLTIVSTLGPLVVPLGFQLWTRLRRSAAESTALGDMVFIAFVVSMGLATAVAVIQWRYLARVVVPLVLVAVSAWESARKDDSIRWGPRILLLSLIAALPWQLWRGTGD